MRTKSIVAGLTLALAAAGLLAQKQSPPPAGQPKDFRVPTPAELKLDNGLEVTFVEYGTVPKVTIELAVLAGNAYEKANQVWLADLAGNLMREGTTTK
ncbi:MAG TPA: insulinase family protein, partial [Thermoanaerobaculia bacterium]|nr:insulinase family protein [Thermoanaerobaculia bacterium]